MNSERPIGIAGAGSIGCFVGGMLAAGGRRVALLARSRVIGEIETHGLRLTSFDGFDRRLAANQFALSENPDVFADAVWKRIICAKRLRLTYVIGPRSAAFMPWLHRLLPAQQVQNIWLRMFRAKSGSEPATDST